jgi:hypothetical protein
MTDSFIRVPPDSGGKRIASQQKTQGVDVVEFQEVLTSYPADATSIGVDVTTSSTAAIGANVNRRGLMVQNVSDTRIIARFDATPTATVGAEIGFAIEPNGGGVLFTALNDQGALNVIHAGVGNKRLLVTEWVG